MNELMRSLKHCADVAYRWYVLRSSWLTLAPVGESAIARAAIAMPLIGYIILLNDDVSHLLEIDPRFKLIHSEEPWRLIMLYFSSAALGVGAALYRSAVPRAIRHGSAIEFSIMISEYVKGHAGAEVIKREAQRIQKSETAPGNVSKSLDDTYKVSSIAMRSGPLTADELTSLSSFIFLYENHAYPAVRFTCRVLFDIAIVLAVIPALATFVGVLHYAWSLIK